MGDPSYTVIGLGMRGVVDQNRNQPDMMTIVPINLSPQIR